MCRVKESVRLEDLGIVALRPKKAQTGAMILQVSGPGGAERADRLATAMREALSGVEGVRVTRPVQMVEFRIRDLDETVTPGDIRAEIARLGSCSESDVRVGPIRPGPDGLGTAWAKCPRSAGAVLSKEGRISVGWLWARVTLLGARPLRCFGCLELGHVIRRCPRGAEKADRCLRCGAAGHRAAGCTAPPRCPACEGAGRPAEHRTGGPQCRAVPVRGTTVVRGAVTSTPARDADAAVAGGAAGPGGSSMEEEISPVLAPPPVGGRLSGGDTPLPRRESREQGTRVYRRSKPTVTSVEVVTVDLSSGTPVVPAHKPEGSAPRAEASVAPPPVSGGGTPMEVEAEGSPPGAGLEGADDPSAI